MFGTRTEARVSEFEWDEGEDKYVCVSACGVTWCGAYVCGRGLCVVCVVRCVCVCVAFRTCLSIRVWCQPPVSNVRGREYERGGVGVLVGDEAVKVEEAQREERPGGARAHVQHRHKHQQLAARGQG